MDQCMYMPLHSESQHTLYKLVPFPPTFKDFPIIDFLIIGLIDLHNIICFWIPYCYFLLVY